MEVIVVASRWHTARCGYIRDNKCTRAHTHTHAYAHKLTHTLTYACANLKLSPSKIGLHAQETQKKASVYYVTTSITRLLFSQKSTRVWRENSGA
jgi:hypothetical protein